MRINPDWLRKLIESLEKEKETNQEIRDICKEALEKALEPHLVWLENKEKAEKRIEELENSLAVLKKLLKKHLD